MASETSTAENKVVDTSVEQLAKVYAKALLGAATEAGNAPALVDELAAFVRDVLDRLPDFANLLSSNLLKHEQRESLLDTALKGKASDTLLNFLKVLSQNDRMMLVRPIATHLKRLFDASQNRYAVEVRFAQPATKEQTEQIRQTIAKRFGIEPDLSVVVDPSLLGGVIIRRGDTVYDGSVRLSLERLRTYMVDHAIEAIESNPGKFLAQAT